MELLRQPAKSASKGLFGITNEDLNKVITELNELETKLEYITELINKLDKQVKLQEDIKQEDSKKKTKNNK